jgi:hypothetical protein
MLDPRKHNYFKKLLALYDLSLIRAAELVVVDIYHDSWCGVYRGQYCNCDPDIELRRYDGVDPLRN